MEVKGIVIMTTVDSDDLAGQIAGELLEQRLAACVQEVRINSRYRWKGKLQRDEEILLLIKTSRQATEAAIQLIKEMHSYAVPEIVALPIVAGLPAYLEWLATEADSSAQP